MHYIPYSEDYLAHHGILGMKWGVRRYQNKDGSLTDAGRKRYGHDPRKDVDYQKLDKVFDSVRSDKRVKQAYSNLRRKTKHVFDYDKLSDEEWYKYADKAAEKAYNQYKKDYPDKDAGELENWKKWYRYDDGDQGDTNSFTAYLESKGIDPVEYGIAAYKAEKEYTEAVRKASARKMGANSDYDADLISQVADNVLNVDLNDYTHSTGWYYLMSL